MSRDNLGFGVMINMLSGNRVTVETLTNIDNKVIKALVLDNDTLFITFNDGKRIKLWDDGQSCCENRYMSTDDVLEQYIGATFIKATIKEGPEIEDENGSCHDVQFLVIVTDRGEISFANHNEHNGYYGGFSLNAAIAD